MVVNADRRKFVRRLVWHLHDQERHYRLCGCAFPLRVGAPQLGGSFRLSGGAGQQDGVELAGLGGEVEPDIVLEQTRFLHPCRGDHHGRVAGPVLGRGHRVVEALDRGGDPPHDRDRWDAVGAVDEPLHDGGLLGPVALARRLHAPVGFVEDEVQREVLVGDGVRQRVPHRECPCVRHQ